MISVCDLNKNEEAYITNINCEDKLKSRLLALGFTNGTKIKIKCFAPLGDPIAISIRNFNIAIRKNDAKYILCKKEINK